jgi:hypothetical protein
VVTYYNQVGGEPKINDIVKDMVNFRNTKQHHLMMLQFALIKAIIVRARPANKSSEGMQRHAEVLAASSSPWPT